MTRSVSVSSNTNPPALLRATSASLYMERTTITEFSDEHEVALSKVLDLAIFSAASSTSAVSSKIVTTFPCPTPRAGVPEEYPA